MGSFEEFLADRAKGYLEGLINDILVEERKEFLKTHDTCGDGYAKRTLRTTLTLDLELRVPRVRKFKKELEFSIFKKYQRTTSSFEEAIEKLYKSRLYESDIAELLKMSSITYDRKRKIIDKYINIYNTWTKEKKKCSKVVKIDSTYFHSKYSKEKYSVYSIFNSYEDSTLELIYFRVELGNENTKGWRKTINHMIENFDLSETKLIVSDMAKHIKNVLYEAEELKEIKKQNCIWHRVMSLCDCVKVNKAKRTELVSKIYTKFISMKEPDYTVFDIFKTFEARTRKIQKWNTTRNIERAIDFHNKDNYNFLELREELGNYQKKELIQTGNVEAYFSKLKNHLKKHTNYCNDKILISKIMMYVEQEKENLEKKRVKKAKQIERKRERYNENLEEKR